jgi:flavin reductase (DIM6/NTAB) family NADH-FMN oxidoreductase RutF
VEPVASRPGRWRRSAAGSHYAINILAAGQRALAERFAGPAAKIASPAWRCARRREPARRSIEGAAAVFECFNRSRYEEGDHVIFVGEVERCEPSRAGASAAALPRRALLHGAAAVDGGAAR